MIEITVTGIDDLKAFLKLFAPKDDRRLFGVAEDLNNAANVLVDAIEKEENSGANESTSNNKGE